MKNFEALPAGTDLFQLVRKNTKRYVKVTREEFSSVKHVLLVSLRSGRLTSDRFHKRPINFPTKIYQLLLIFLPMISAKPS